MRYGSIAARLSFGAFVVALAIALTASFGTRLGFWEYTRGFQILLPGVVTAVVALLAGAFWLASALRNNDSEGWRWGAPGLFGALVLVWIPASVAIGAVQSPPIHDISTDVGNAPPFHALLPLRKGAANGPEYDGARKVVLKRKITTVAELQKKAWPDVKTYAVLLNPKGDPKIDPKAILFWRGFQRAKRMGWNIVAFSEKDGIIEATDTTMWFGFTDDIVIRVQQAGALGARLDIRSKARIGTADYGRNARRIMDYLKAIKR
jgi:Protein of unknown function (DUF1499)